MDVGSLSSKQKSTDVARHICTNKSIATNHRSQYLTKVFQNYSCSKDVLV